MYKVESLDLTAKIRKNGDSEVRPPSSVKMLRIREFYAGPTDRLTDYFKLSTMQRLWRSGATTSKCPCMQNEKKATDIQSILHTERVNLNAITSTVLEAYMKRMMN